jgi:D-tyrosyl-tRNA(Tyr) deacylase
VSSASVAVANARDELRETARIGPGLLVLLGVLRGDGPADATYIASKVEALRVFEDPADEKGRLNRSVLDVGGSVLVVSQFTLAGDCRRGRRPSFDAAADAATARPLCEDVVRALRTSGVNVSTGEFQAHMQVALVNDGPVTLLLDSRKTF